MARRRPHLVLMAEDGDHIIGCAWACPVCHPDRALKWTVSPSYYATVLSDRALGYRDWPGRRKGAKR